MTAQPSESVLEIWYRNHAGQIARRRIIPERIYFGTSHWHDGPPQWFLVGRDLDRNAVRHYAMADMLGREEPRP